VDQRKAAPALRRLGLSLTIARTQPSRRASGTILFQDPKPGTEVPEGSSVKVVVARSVIQ
jgi:beta-lactam-binding protein with PASTA domain